MMETWWITTLLLYLIFLNIHSIETTGNNNTYIIQGTIS